MSDEYIMNSNMEPEEYPGMTDGELSERIASRRGVIEKKRKRKKRTTLLLMILVFALLATMCGKDIVRLKAENRALKRQQAALEKERDALKEELKNTGNQEYIREQARRQLRLLNPGEILFTFEDDEGGKGSGSGGADE